MVGPSHPNETLIQECQGLVRFLAQQVRKRVPAFVDMDDLIGYGQVGLMQAARDFDAAQGVRFSTYAYYRIRGAIYDGVNKLMWCRSVRDADYKYDQTADSLLQSTSGDAKVNDDLADEVQWFSRTVAVLSMSYLASTDGVGKAAETIDTSTQAPWSGIVERETHVQLAEAIDRLPRDSALLIRAIYYDDCTLQEAANTLKISKSWASRMHAKALEQIARHLRQANLGCEDDREVS